MVRGSNPSGSKIFRTCPGRACGPPSPLYNDYRVFSAGKERPERDADSSPPTSAVGPERVELYLYSPLWAERPLQSLSVSTRVHFTYFLQNTKYSSVVIPNIAAWPNFLNAFLFITKVTLDAFIHYVMLLITMLVRLSYAIYFSSSFVSVCFPISLYFCLLACY